MTSDRQRDVIVIGAGISGLSAAKLLHDEGLDVLVLEANDRVGGRTLNYYDDAIQYTDVGGAYMGPTQNRIHRLSKELGVKNYICYDEGIALAYMRGKRRTMTGLVPDTYNPFLMMDFHHFARLVDEMAKQIPLDRPWDFPQAAEWDSMTVKEWADKTFWFQATKDFVNVQSTLGLCVEGRDLSLLYFLWYIKSGSGYLVFSSTTNGAQERKFVGGSHRISVTMAERLGKDRVLLSKPAAKINQDSDGVTVTTTTGESHKAKYVIAALPPAVMNKISFTPSLSALRNQLNQRYPMGSVIKVMMYYDKAFWKDSNYSCLVLADGIICGTQDDCKPDSSYPAIIGFVGGDAARQYCTLTKDQRRDLIAQRYSEIFNSKEALKPRYYVEKNWMEEEYIGGGYVGTTPPGVITKYGKVLREPVGRVHFAGTETATQWSGYMDGAVQAGERAAREILHILGRIPKEQIWQDEPEPVEMPLLPWDEPLLPRILPSVSGFLKFVGVSTTACSVGALTWFFRDQIKSLIPK